MPNEDRGPAIRTAAALVVGGSMLALTRLPTPEARALRDADAEVAAAKVRLAAAAAAARAEADEEGIADAAALEKAGIRVPRRRERSGVGCQPIAVTEGATPADDVTIRWFDAHCQPREAIVVSPEKRDASGAPAGGGYIRELSYVSSAGASASGSADGQVRAVGTGVNGWNGFGYVVAHYPLPSGGDDFDAAETIHAPGTHAIALRGAHHVLYRASWRLSPGAPVDVTVEWLFATGRDAPLFSITYDARPAGPGAVLADSRAPYGDMAFEGDPGGEIGGVAWGDRYRFITMPEPPGPSPAPLSFASSWEYRAPNVVPFDRIWSRGRDAEMGLVGTARWSDKPQGGDYGPGAARALWGQAGRGLPTSWAWPYQIDQYDLPFGPSSHRLAWGETFGAIGQPAYAAFDRVASGYPFQSYSVHVVLGPRDDSAVMAAVAEAEAAVGTDLRTSRGHVATDAPGGIARTDTVALSLPGWDPVYAAWTIDADGHGGGNVSGHFHVPDGAALASPMLRVSGWNRPTVNKLLVNRDALSATDTLATVDATTHTLWLTLPTVLRGDVDFTLD